MKYHPQTIEHDPDNGNYGDCFRTVLACLLDLEPEAVPHFLHDGDVTMGHGRAQQWLAEKYRMTLVSIPIAAPHRGIVMETMGLVNPHVPYMLVGKSMTGVNHHVICRQDKIIHDPNGMDIVGPAADGNFWVEFLAAIEPFEALPVDYFYKEGRDDGGEEERQG